MTRLPLIAAVVLTVLAGCDKRETEPVRIMHPQIHWEDVAGESVRPADDAYQNLVPDGTDGLFPAAIAVARVTVDGRDTDDDQHRLVLDMKPANDFLSWNGLFDNLRYVSEVFPMSPGDLSEDEPSAGRIVSAAGELKADLCLVYGRTDLSPTEAETRGVLYQVATGKPLAAIHAHVSIPHPELVERSGEQAKGDRRHCDPRYLADLRFERLALETVRDLRRGDRPVTVEPPQGWTPEEPIVPRDWPPQPFGKP